MSAVKKKKKYTPTLDAITSYEHVYEPAEDSFLIMDALEEDVAHLRGVHADVVVEVGVGSGILSSFFDWLARGGGDHGLASNPSIIGVDLNIRACEAANSIYAENNVANAETVNSDLFGAFRTTTPFIDVAIFNPPYLPSTMEEAAEGGFTAAWAGGPRGRLITDRFLEGILPLLVPGTGTLYLLLIHQNDPDEVVEMMEDRGCDAEIIKDRHYMGEHAYILRIVRRGDAA